MVQHTQSHAILDLGRAPGTVPFDVGGLNRDRPSVYLHIQLAEGAPVPVGSENHITKAPITPIMSRLSVDQPNRIYFAEQPNVYQYVLM